MDDKSPYGSAQIGGTTMGYLNNESVSVEAILTKKGRELLAKNIGLNITQFGVADDEVDYGLYTTNHPLGSAYYGSIIESMPLVEASPDETQTMKYKLVSLPQGTNLIPVINIGATAVTLTYGQPNPYTITPGTSQGLNASPFGYTAVLYNSDAASLTGAGLSGGSTPTIPTFLSDAQSTTATVVQGLTFSLLPKNVASAITTQVTIIGNQTGASVTIQLTVNPTAN